MVPFLGWNSDAGIFEETPLQELKFNLLEGHEMNF